MRRVNLGHPRVRLLGSIAEVQRDDVRVVIESRALGRHVIGDDQIDALVDLMMNFDRFAQDQISIKSLIKPAAPAPAAAASVKDSDKTAAKADE